MQLCPLEPSQPHLSGCRRGNATLTAYLNAVDAGGINAGEYLFLRISYDVNPIPGGNNFYSVLTDNAGGTNEKPLLTLTAEAIPEPSVYALLATCGIALLFRRWKTPSKL